MAFECFSSSGTAIYPDPDMCSERKIFICLMPALGRGQLLVVMKAGHRRMAGSRRFFQVMSRERVVAEYFLMHLPDEWMTEYGG